MLPSPSRPSDKQSPADRCLSGRRTLGLGTAGRALPGPRAQTRSLQALRWGNRSSESVTGFCPRGSCSPGSLLDTSVHMCACTCVCASVENESPGPLQAHSRSLSSPNHGHSSCCLSPEELPETRLGASCGAVAPSPAAPAPTEPPARAEGQRACQPRPQPCPRLTSPPASDTRAGWAAPQSGCETAPWGQAGGSEGSQPPGTRPGTLRTLPGSFGTPLLTAGAGRAASSTGGLGHAGRARGRGAGAEGALRLPERPAWCCTSWLRLSRGADALGDPLATRHPTEAQEGTGPPRTHRLLVASWTPCQAGGSGERPGPAGLPTRDWTLKLLHGPGRACFPSWTRVTY